MLPRTRPFLSAEWRHLAMLNYAVDPMRLQPLVPAGTELDPWQGRTYASVVAFLFLDTRVGGIGIPFHRNFEEVNLRFYVRRKVGPDWRRGVVFVKELVPRFAIALTARLLYGERYISTRMAHRIHPGATGTPASVSYSWWRHGRENRVDLSGLAATVPIAPGSEAEFITEHYWGYAQRANGMTTEYQVHHPRWRVATATSGTLSGDVAATYGAAWADTLQTPPLSAFLAEGSAVDVSWGAPL